MDGILIGFILGLLVGWNVFPQPVWIKQGWGWAWGKLKKSSTEETKTEDTSNTA